MFAVLGLGTAIFSVILILPLWDFHSVEVPKVFKTINHHTELLSRLKIKTKVFLFLPLLLSSLYFLTKVKFNDDVRILQSQPLHLIEDENAIFEVVGSRPPSSRIFLRASSIESLVDIEESFIDHYPKNSFNGISHIISSPKRQKENYLLYKKLFPEYRLFYKKLGLSEDKIDNLIKSQNQPFLEINFLKTIENLPYEQKRQSWLGQINDHYYTVLYPDLKFKAEKIPSLFKDHAVIVNEVKDASNVFKKIHKKIRLVFPIFIFIIFVFLFIIWRSWYVFQVLLFPLFSSYYALVFSGYLIGYVNLFNWLALILVFFLGLDYSIFYYLEKNKWHFIKNSYCSFFRNNNFIFWATFFK